MHYSEGSGWGFVVSDRNAGLKEDRGRTVVATDIEGRSGTRVVHIDRARAHPHWFPAGSSAKKCVTGRVIDSVCLGFHDAHGKPHVVEFSSNDTAQ